MFINPAAFAQGKHEKQLITAIDQLVSTTFASIAPGCVVLIAKKGEVFYKHAFGFANLECKVAMSDDMIFRIGSITKQYTAVGILQLVEQHQINLQDSLQQFIKDFPQHGHRVTIENLLTHSSGIKGYDAMDFYNSSAERLEYTPKQIIDSIKRSSPEFIPGSKFNYSNSNYFILAYIIEIVSGKPYQEYLQEQVFKPFGLSHTYYDNPYTIIPGRCSGYTKSGTSFLNATYRNMSSIYGAGALLSNVDDLFKWHQLLYSYKIIEKETLEKASTPFKLSNGAMSEYGYGWFIKGFYSDTSIGHGGAIDGFRSMEFYIPGKDIFIAVLANADNDYFNDWFQRLAELVVDKKSSNVPAVPEISEQVLDSYTGTYRNDKYKVTFKIYKENGNLYSDLSNGTGSHMRLVAQSKTRFTLQITTATSIEFVVENGKLTKLIATQKEKNEFIKID